MISKTFFLNKSAKKNMVMIAFRTAGKRTTISTGVIVSEKDWDASTGRIKGKESDAIIRNQRLARWEMAANKVILKMDYENNTDLEQAKFYILSEMDIDGDKPIQNNLLLPYYYKWSITTTTKRVASGQMSYNFKKIKEFVGDRKITFRDVTIKFCEEYIEWLSAQNISANTRGTHIKNLKTVMQQAYDQKLHENLDFKKFRKETEEADSFYLTTEELDKIEKMNLVGTKDLVRDLFLVGCYTALRWSDYSRLSIKDVDNGLIRNTNQKTGARVIIPLHPTVERILTKYQVFPYISQQKFNDIIKTICCDAGINSKVTIRRDKVETEYEKWEVITSHTARRTGATNMFKAGIPAISIMKITGHTTESNFMRYLKISNEENAELLKNNEFFSKKR